MKTENEIVKQEFEELVLIEGTRREAGFCDGLRSEMTKLRKLP